MITLDRAGLLATAARDGTIGEADVLALRRAFWGDGAIALAEADILFEIDAASDRPSARWVEFLVEAVVHHVVDQAEPHGYVDDAKADWLMARITADGHCRGATELELIAKVVETARGVPARFAAFALAEVHKAVVSGSGAIRNGAMDPARMTMAEVALLRRILFAVGGDGGMTVTRREAEALFDIDDAVGPADNVPEWASLFAKAVGNYLFAAMLVTPPSRDDVLARQRWLDAPPEGLGGFLGRMAGALGNLGGVLDHVTGRSSAEDGWAEENRRDEAAVAEARQLTASEAEWVFERIGRNGSVTPAEAALLRFIEQSAASLPASFADYLARLPKAG